MLNFKRQRLLQTTILCGFAAAVAVSGSAVAQTTAAPAAPAKPNEEVVVVTGTRIQRPNTVSNSPITSVTADSLITQNTVNIETKLRTLPQFTPGSTEYSNNTDGPEGVATINLRGLGTNRTLVLMDGKRLPAFDATGVVDINMVPLALVERIDIVTGGASAVYGSDAIAGVVNFVMKKNFQGIQVDLNGTRFGEGDGDTKNLALTIGSNFADDRGNAVLSLAYSTREAVFQGARAYSNFNLDPSAGAADLNDPSRRAGSSNAGWTRVNLGAGNRWFTNTGAVVGPAATVPAPNNLSFNFNPFNYFQVPQERYQATTLLNYEVSENLEVYARAMFASSSVDTQLAPSAFFGGSTADFTINLDNPFLSAAQRAALVTRYNALNPTAPYNPALTNGSQQVGVPGIRRRLIEGGNRIGINDTETWQISGGAKGKLGDSGFDWEVSGSQGSVLFNGGTENDVSIDRARNALLAINGPNGPVCLSGGNCVPINIFSGNGQVDPSTGVPTSGVVTAAAIDYVRANYYQTQKTTQQVFNANISGDVGITIPTASSPISIALGGEYRRDSTDYRPDDLTTYGGAMGQGGTSPPLAGTLSSTDLFGELFVPLVEGKPFAEVIALELGYRQTYSSDAGNFGSYKAGIEWAPVSGLRARGMFQRAVRAPNLNEVYAPAAFGLAEIQSDPCAGAAPVTNAALRAICIAQGAPASTIGFIDNPAAQQAASATGGAFALGVQLDPEVADTLTVGFVVTPSLIPNLTASIDYYNVKIEDAIDDLPAQLVVDDCFVRNVAASCGLITRNRQGNLEGDGFGIRLPIANLATLEAEGIDYNIGYRLEFDAFGAQGVVVNLNLNGTHTLTNQFKPTPVADTVKCAGYYGPNCGEPIAKNKWVARADTSLGDFGFGIGYRYVGAVKIEPGQEGNYKVEKIKAEGYLDLNLSWDFTKNFTLNVSVDNVLDNDPPQVNNIPGANTSMNTYAGTYDPLGPRIGLGIKAKF
jgi:iron complex outermembrane recepter protein